MTDKEIRVPDLGSFKDVAVIEILVKPGESLEVDTALATLETEKATMDVPAFKIASADLCNPYLIAKAASLGIPLILSLVVLVITIWLVLDIISVLKGLLPFTSGE
jgi:hypothetical protein